MSEGYSGTPLAKKLGIRAGQRVALVAAPDGFVDILEGLGGDGFAGEGRAGSVEVRHDLRGTRAFDIVVWFPRDARDLRACFSSVAGRLSSAGGLWVSWPKKASGVKTDLHDGVVRETGLHAGLVDNKVCAISEVYSGLRFVRRVSDR